MSAVGLLLRKPFAFVLRDLRNALSYRFEVMLILTEVFFVSILFYFVAQLVDLNTLVENSGVNIPDWLRGADFFGFLLIGVAVASFLNVSLNGFASQVRDAQMTGTFEALLVTPTSIPVIIISSTVGPFAFATLRVLLYLLIGSLLFDMTLSIGNLPAALLVLVFTVIVFCAIGIFSASFVMVFKRGDPIARLVTAVSLLFGGVYFPVEILPEEVQFLSKAVPITPSLSALRRMLLAGEDLSAVYDDVITLFIFAAVLLPIALLCFAVAVRAAKRDGTLTHY